MTTFSFFIGLVMVEQRAMAQSPCEASICKITSIQGQVSAKRKGHIQWIPVRLGDAFCPGDRILTGENSRAAVVLSNESVLRIDQRTTIVFLGMEGKRSFLLDLLDGAIHLFSRKARSLKLSTPFVNAAVEGTEFFVKVDSDRTQITLFEGRVLADNAHGRLLLSKGQSAVVHAEQAPELKFVVRPRDAVQWTLYYSPIIGFDSDDYDGAFPEPLQSKINRSLAFYRQGDLSQALTVIDGFSNDMGDGRFFVYRASLSLAVGRVSNALADIERAINLDANNSRAMALRSIIAVVQLRKEDAYADARKAVALDPDSPSALIALSYAHQAMFSISEAVDVAESAVGIAPDSAIAHARLAELRLSTEDLDGALRAAQRAATLDDNIARAHTVLGFAYLTQVKMGASKDAFNKAIRLDSAAPLPRLGLGLVNIRQGRLKQGRANIEMAAALDPGNALIRSYLGKAYFDEKRRPLEADQFEMAKSLDPLDPTPWYYDAIRKQTQNRPVDALHDLQKSIELNNNRAVYRSRLLMDEDLAARSASMGRIYNDLGFQELAFRQAWGSLQADPANYSAHRLLADSYSARPRYEIARVSELLQAQLLQPLSIEPVQPQLAESNLHILEGAGPGSLSFNEFNPLFARNRLAGQANGVAGDNETWGDEVTLSGIHNRISGSVGQYHFETNGFRKNNYLDQDIYSAFAQAALTPKINIQTEFRHRRDKHGDLSFYWDLYNPDTTILKDMESDTMRAGLHLKPTTHSDVLASLIYKKSSEYQEFMIFNRGLESESISSEAQYINKSQNVDIIVGGGYYHIDEQWYFNRRPIEENKVEHSIGYVYGYVRYPTRLTWTIGASFDSLKRPHGGDEDQFNPKLGLNLEVSENTDLRLAAFTGLKRTMVADQTIEPTHVAGFNQFFDDFNGTKQTVYGVGVDHKFSMHLYGGAEFHFRRLEKPNTKANRTDKEDWDEDAFRCYLYWTVYPDLVIGLEYQYDKFDAEIVDSVTVPDDMETHQFPISISYFHPSGGYGRLVTTYVDQEIAIPAQSATTLHDDFVLVDLTAGYRFPKRYGLISVGIRNVFDQNFNFMDVAERSSQSVIAPFNVPERTFMLSLTLSF